MDERFTLDDLFVLIAGAQGTYSLVMIGFMLFYILLAWKGQKERRKFMIAFLLSHFGLIIATAITLYSRKYLFGHIWYWVVLCSYIPSDFVLMKILVRIIKLNKKLDSV
jgi:hypothetical protein